MARLGGASISLGAIIQAWVEQTLEDNPDITPESPPEDLIAAMGLEGHITFEELQEIGRQQAIPDKNLQDFMEELLIEQDIITKQLSHRKQSTFDYVIAPLKRAGVPEISSPILGAAPKMEPVPPPPAETVTITPEEPIQPDNASTQDAPPPTNGKQAGDKKQLEPKKRPVSAAPPHAPNALGELLDSIRSEQSVKDFVAQIPRLSEKAYGHIVKGNNILDARHSRGLAQFLKAQHEDKLPEEIRDLEGDDLARALAELYCPIAQEQQSSPIRGRPARGHATGRS